MSVASVAVNSFLSDREVAIRLNVSPVTVMRLRQRGELAYYRIGGRVAISPEQLAAYLSRSERPANQPGARAMPGSSRF